ncbi:GrpB family protein [Schumannella luteola]
MDDGISEYTPSWQRWFAEIRDALPAGLIVEHVGSTSVPGLAAKPIIDIDVVVEAAEVADSIAVLEAAGWVHEGDLGIAGRETFRSRSDLPPHHLYVVVRGSAAHRDHIDLRDHLRVNPADASRYEAVKRSLEHLLTVDRVAYTEGKGPIITELLARARDTTHA